GSDVSLVAELVRAHRPAAVALLDRAAIDRLARELAPPRPELLAGVEGLAALATDVPADVVVSALVGAAGLVPTLGAIRAGRTIALANKETLVMAGVLTASGGPFRGWSRTALEGVTVEQALRHPTWRMGSKITIDSATLMNKGLE